MGKNDAIFRQFQKDSRPLSAYLRRTYGEVALDLIPQFDPGGSDEAVRSVVDRLVEHVRVQPPALGGVEKGRSDAADGEWRPSRSGSGVQVATTRHYVAIQIDGEAGLLAYWPDEQDSGLEPVDHFDESPWIIPEPGADHDYDLELLRHNRRLESSRWFVGMRDQKGEFALYTFEDLTSSEEEQVLEGTLDPRAAIDQRRAGIEPIVRAIAVQTDDFFDRQLPKELEAAVLARRRRLAARAAVGANLTWPEGWKFDAPQVVDADDTPQSSSSDGEDLELVVTHRPRLASVTYRDVLRTIRVWADAVERYPDAFAPLIEDRLSDLLAATLNASLPGAGREVYTRGGKSDLFIRADVLNEGSGPAKIFICESKKWHGESEVCDELDQLLGYLEAKDTAAVLLYFVGNVDPAAVRPKAVAVLEARDDFEGREAELVSGWPILRFAESGRKVSICVAFVDLLGT